MSTKAKTPHKKIDLSIELIVTLFSTTDKVSNYITAVLNEHGDLTKQQYNVLRILRGAGIDGLPVLEIANRMIERTPGMTRMLDRLEKKELVSRHRCTVDRRVYYATITQHGLDVLAKLDQPILDADHNITANMDKNEVSQLIDLLQKIHIPPHSD